VQSYFYNFTPKKLLASSIKQKNAAYLFSRCVYILRGLLGLVFIYALSRLAILIILFSRIIPYARFPSSSRLSLLVYFPQQQFLIPPGAHLSFSAAEKMCKPVGGQIAVSCCACNAHKRTGIDFERRKNFADRIIQLQHCSTIQNDAKCFW
jgi:hypothetical protein